MHPLTDQKVSKYVTLPLILTCFVLGLRPRAKIPLQNCCHVITSSCPNLITQIWNIIILFEGNSLECSGKTLLSGSHIWWTSLVSQLYHCFIIYIALNHVVIQISWFPWYSAHTEILSYNLTQFDQCLRHSYGRRWMWNHVINIWGYTLHVGQIFNQPEFSIM